MLVDSVFPFLTSVFIGIGLSLALGFRIFIPLFITGISIKQEWVQVSDSYLWLGENTFLIGFGIGIVIEFLALHIPIIDNVIKFLTLPLSFVTATLVMNMVLSEGNSVPYWLLSAFFGGGLSIIGNALSNVIRVVVTTLTAGIGSMTYNIIETVKVLILSVLSIFFPLLVIILFIISIPFIKKGVATLKNYKNRKVKMT